MAAGEAHLVVGPILGIVTRAGETTAGAETTLEGAGVVGMTTAVEVVVVVGGRVAGKNGISGRAEGMRGTVGRNTGPMTTAGLEELIGTRTAAAGKAGTENEGNWR